MCVRIFFLFVNKYKFIKCVVYTYVFLFICYINAKLYGMVAKNISTTTTISILAKYAQVVYCTGFIITAVCLFFNILLILLLLIFFSLQLILILFLIIFPLGFNKLLNANTFSRNYLDITSDPDFWWVK